MKFELKYRQNIETYSNSANPVVKQEPMLGSTISSTSRPGLSDPDAATAAKVASILANANAPPPPPPPEEQFQMQQGMEPPGRQWGNMFNQYHQGYGNY